MKRSIGVWKRIEGVFLACLLFVFLTGCNEEVQLQDGTNIQLDKEGGVTVTYIEEFPSDYYDVTELEQMNAEEVAGYNSLVGEEVVTVISTVTDGSKVTLAMHYADLEDYGDMNGIKAYSGTVSQAIALGYDLGDAFADAKTGEKITDISWDDLANKHVVIISEEVILYPYSKIEMVTDNVKVSEDRKIATVTGEEQAVIVFK